LIKGKNSNNPWGEVLRTANGTLFGTTELDGSPNLSEGTVWKYVP